MKKGGGEERGTHWYERGKKKKGVGEKRMVAVLEL